MAIEFETVKMPKGNWIGDEKIALMAKQNWKLYIADDSRDLTTNDPEEGTRHYVFYRDIPDLGIMQTSS